MARTFHFRCLATDLSTILDLTIDILLNPTFPQAEWDRVRGQTLAALRSERDNAESRAYRGLLSALYPDEHPYRFPLVGHEASVSAFTPADLAAFHARFLLASEATIVVAGDVDPERLAAELNQRLPAAWTRGTAIASAEPPVAPHWPSPGSARPPGRSAGRGAGRAHRVLPGRTPTSITCSS